MKCKMLYSLLVILLAFPTLVKAQSPSNPVVYKNWAVLVEKINLVDVSYRIVRCDTVNQIHFLIFNGSSVDKMTNFDFLVTNIATGDKYTGVVSFATSRATTYKALCDSDASLNQLKINLPTNFDPNNITVAIILKP